MDAIRRVPNHADVDRTELIKVFAQLPAAATPPAVVGTVTAAPSDDLPPIRTLDDVVHWLNRLFAVDDVNVEAVHYVMSAYQASVADWKRYAVFDRFRYTRNLVSDGNGKYNLIVLCWGEGHATAIHDHSNSHCFMKILDGTLREVRYDWPAAEGDPMLETGRTDSRVDDVLYMSDELGLHMVENPSSSDKAVSLHLYCPPYDTCRMFNRATSKAVPCQITFWTMYGKKTNLESACCDATPSDK